MKKVAMMFGLLFASSSFAITDVTIWETEEIPVGKVCPSQAQRYDEIAYQVNGNGGYVCFICDYSNETPLLVVTAQTRCPKTIECKNGKCK